MDPKINLSDITIGGYESAEDTITLSSYPWSNTTISGGGYTVNNAGISASSYPYTITGSNTAPLTLNAGTGISNPWSFSNSISPKIQLNGDGADIEVNGWSLIESIKRIEQRLNILHPNEKLEAEWEELRALGDKYRQLEQHIRDKQATWDRLKAMPQPVVD
jgi:hypothetical protein